MVTGQNSVKPYRLIFFLLLATTFLFRLWFMTTLPLSGDESYHWEWSRHLALGYYDHPGLTAYLIRLSTLLFGRSTEFTVRLPALVMLSGTALVCFFLAKRIVKDRGGSEETGEIAGLLAGSQILVVPVFAVFSVYISTDPPFIFFWSLTLYLLYCALWDGKWRYWIGTGIAFGLALMSKFLGFFMFGVAGLFVLLSARDRVWFRRPQGYVALGCAFLVFLPLLWWDATHGWATFMFNLVYRQKQTGFSVKHTGEFLMGQALALSPGIFAFALFGLYRSLRDWVSRKDRSSLFLGLGSLVPLMYFFYVSFRRRVGVHWPAGGWVGAIVYLSCYWAGAKASYKGGVMKIIKILALALCVLTTVSIHLLAHIPPKRVKMNWSYAGNAGRINTGKHTERFGWRELGRRVCEVRDELLKAQSEPKTRSISSQLRQGYVGQTGQALRLRSGQGGVFVICAQYGLASNVAFYTPGQIRTHLWSSRKTHGENYRFWDDFASFRGMDAVFVAKRESTAELSVGKLEEHFRRVDKAERIPIVVDGEEVRSFYLIRCYEFDGVEPEWQEGGVILTLTLTLSPSG